jgi:Major capsid protein Gp23
MNELFENWSEIKETLLDGLDASKKKIVGTLLENQKQHILSESAAAGATGANDIAGFRKILIPMIRRIIPGTIATEIVGVQPMQGPVGLVYTMRYLYGEAVTVPAAGTAANPWAANGSDGTIAANSEMFGNNPVLRQFYSGNAGAVVSDGGADQPAGASGITNTVADAANIQGAASRGAWPSSLPAYGTSAFGPYPAVGSDAIGQKYAGRLYGGTGSFIEGSGGRTGKLEVISQAVEAGTRKLQAGWTVEAMQDAKSQHGINLESELSQVISAEIVQEIDSEILSDLVALAGTVGVYDYATIGVGPGYQPAYLGDRFANLGVVINAVANEIARKTRRGAGNFIVVSPMVVSILQSAAKSVFAPAVAGSFKGPNNTMLVGTLNGNIKVYSYLWNQVSGLSAATNDVILVGYKGGNGETDTGYFYCPYIPLMSSGVVINPVTFQPVMSMMTRYGKTAFTQTQTSLGNSADYYGKINVSNFQFA